MHLHVPSCFWGKRSGFISTKRCWSPPVWSASGKLFLQLGTFKPEKDQGHLCSCLSKVSPMTAVGGSGRWMHAQARSLSPSSDSTVIPSPAPSELMVVFLGQDVSFLKASRTSKHCWQVIHTQTLSIASVNSNLGAWLSVLIGHMCLLSSYGRWQSQASHTSLCLILPGGDPARTTVTSAKAHAPSLL